MTADADVEVFAHIAPRMCFDGKTLTLMDIAPSTIRMSRPTDPCGPAPELDYLPTGAFLDRWAVRSREAGPAGCRMIGTLSLLDPDAQIAGPALVRLSAPRLTADGLAYDLDVLEGIVPGSSGACVLFLEWGDTHVPRDPAPPPPPPRRPAT
jgi:hypothetical protein